MDGDCNCNCSEALQESRKLNTTLIAHIEKLESESFDVHIKTRDMNAFMRDLRDENRIALDKILDELDYLNYRKGDQSVVKEEPRRRYRIGNG